MKYLILALLIVSCGTDEPLKTANEPTAISQETLETEEPDTITTLMCQQAVACDAEGTCVDIEKPVEFEVNDDLIYWQACFNFRACDGKDLYSEEQIETYRQVVCEG